MFDRKLRVEKVEMVKRVIRQNNYRDYQRTHQQCLDMGINVNRQALDRFADKLELIDNAERNRLLIQQPLNQQSVNPSPTDDSNFSHSSNSLSPRQNVISTAVEEQMVKQAVRGEMTYEQVKIREAEITFELGKLKIREAELLNELNQLSEHLTDKH